MGMYTSIFFNFPIILLEALLFTLFFRKVKRTTTRRFKLKSNLKNNIKFNHHTLEDKKQENCHIINSKTINNTILSFNLIIQG